MKIDKINRLELDDDIKNKLYSTLDENLTSFERSFSKYDQYNMIYSSVSIRLPTLDVRLQFVPAKATSSISLAIIVKKISFIWLNLLKIQTIRKIFNSIK